MEEEDKPISDFEHELMVLINSRCMENESDTPDFLLARFIQECLDSFNAAVKARDKRHGITQRAWNRPATTQERDIAGNIPVRDEFGNLLSRMPVEVTAPPKAQVYEPIVKDTTDGSFYIFRGGEWKKFIEALEPKAQE